MSATVSSLSKRVELELCLAGGNRGILGDSESTALLLDHVDQAEGVSGRIKVIEVSPVSYLSSEVLITAPHDGGEHLAQAGGVSSILGHNILALSLPPVLGVVRIVGHIFVAWLGWTIEDLRLTGTDSLTRVMAILEGHIYQHPLGDILERRRS